MKKTNVGFSLSEALITLMIISLILAAVLPVISKRNNTSDSIWKYVSTGAGSNSNIFYGLGTSQTAIIGHNTVPDSSSGSRLILVTPADNSYDTIKRSILDFQQKSASGVAPIGRISFDSTGNVAVGKNSLIATTVGAYSIGKYNTAIGYESLKTNETGYNNTAVGYYSLLNNKSGNNNIAIGSNAMQINTTGSDNVAIGEEALFYNQIGTSNVAIGKFSLYRNTSNSNTAVGANSLAWNTKGKTNTAIGSYSLYSNDTGDNNIAIGSSALMNNKTGGNNTAIGQSALSSGSISSGFNVAVGTQSQEYSNDGDCNTSMGYQSLRGTSNLNARHSYNNVAVGYMSLNISQSDSNTAVGANSLLANLHGHNNVAIGTGAMSENVHGNYNTAVGVHAAGKNQGARNVAVGMSTLYNNTTGSFNTAIGDGACSKVVGDYNICIGYSAGPTTVSAKTKELFIDVTGGPDPLIWGNFATKEVKINGTLTTTGTINGTVVGTSDKNLKNIIGDNNVGIEKINKIHVVDYVFKNDKTKRPRVGIIAQELQKIFPNSVYTLQDGTLAVNTDEMFYAMLNSIKEMYIKLQTAISKISHIEAVISELKKENIELKKQNEKLLDQNKDMSLQIKKINQRLAELEKKR